MTAVGRVASAIDARSLHTALRSAGCDIALRLVDVSDDMHAIGDDDWYLFTWSICRVRGCWSGLRVIPVACGWPELPPAWRVTNGVT